MCTAGGSSQRKTTARRRSRPRLSASAGWSGAGGGKRKHPDRITLKIPCATEVSRKTLPCAKGVRDVVQVAQGPTRAARLPESASRLRRRSEGGLRAHLLRTANHRAVTWSARGSARAYSSRSRDEERAGARRQAEVLAKPEGAALSPGTAETTASRTDLDWLLSLPLDQALRIESSSSARGATSTFQSTCHRSSSSPRRTRLARFTNPCAIVWRVLRVPGYTEEEKVRTAYRPCFRDS